jgi:peptidoglycan/LPS O-acetylase OafA/YrhL
VPESQSHHSLVPDASARQGERMLAVDALRGVMALSVAIYHLSVWTLALSGPLRTVATLAGIYSVQGFFIVSGLCFFRQYDAAALSGGGALGRFYLKRFLRIAPLFYLAILLNYLAGQPIDPRAGWARVLENLSLCFALSHPNHALVLGGWSIGIEWLFYLAFPLLLRAQQVRPLWYALVVLSLSWAVPYTFFKVAATPTAKQFNVYVSVGNHACLFLIGALIAEWHARTRARLSGWLTLPLGLALAWFVGRGQPEIIDHVDAMVGGVRVRYVALCASAVALAAFTAPARTWRTALLGALGDISYSVYLMHPFAWWIGQRVLWADASPLAQLGLGALLTLALATLTHKWIERPAMALARRTRRARQGELVRSQELPSRV